MKKIDMHIHAYNRQTNQEQLLSALGQAGIDGCCVFSTRPVEASSVEGIPFEQRLAEALGWAMGYEDRIFPVLWIHPFEEDILNKVHIAAQAGIAAFKIICTNFYVSDPRCLEVVREIARLGKPVIFHSGILWDGQVSSDFNRPLHFEEFEEKLNQIVMVSATPAEYEAKHAQQVVEQIIRPTGLVDPRVEVRPAETQVDDLIGEIRTRIQKKERVLVTTLTKKMAEDLTEYLDGLGIRVKYIHHNIDAMERTELLRNLRMGIFDVLVGINLLREGIDLPEVTLVTILDADKEGLFRSERSLIQMIGRAARNADGTVILYADSETESMRRALEETDRRRAIQMAYNEEHGIIPKTIVKEIAAPISIDAEETAPARGKGRKKGADKSAVSTAVRGQTKEQQIEALRKEMQQAAKDLRFEEAAYLRDKIKELELTK